MRGANDGAEGPDAEMEGFPEMNGEFPDMENGFPEMDGGFEVPGGGPMGNMPGR